MKQKTTKQESSKADILDQLLERLVRYDATIAGGCECCGTWIEYDQYVNGDLVKFDELEALIEELKKQA